MHGDRTGLDQRQVNVICQDVISAARRESIKRGFIKLDVWGFSLWIMCSSGELSEITV